MFEITQPPTATAPLTRPPSYAGHERRATGSDLAHWLRRMLDEIDYGMLMVTGDGQVSYFNHAARLELDGAHPLQMLGRTLRAHRPQDVAPLYDALAAAQRGLRRLLTLGDGEQRVSVSVVPLPQAGGEQGAGGADQRQPLVLLVLGKRQVCEQLSVQGFARSVALTPAETRVLELLCAGVRPGDIAQRQGVAISTVRTQIGSIRAKTGAASIRELVRQVAVLPPLVGALRQAPCAVMQAAAG
ncbi:MAG: PAS domain-containing protein [Rubrivivax sp.]|nr:PAS domain-containing protein [Rubrivivax sp.]